MKPTKTIAIIPARGGSKRLPGKNIKMLGALPLIAHSIQYAQRHSDIIDQIYVSTDSLEIKTTSEQYGALVIDRPAAISGDQEPTITTLQHVLSVLPQTIENVILLQPTNPLRPEGLLPEAFAKYTKGDHDSLLTVTRNLEKLGKLINNQFIPYNYTLGQRSQDLEPLYSENGLLYITRASLIKKGILIGPRHTTQIVDHAFAKADIDTLQDFEYTSYLLNQHKK